MRHLALLLSSVTSFVMLGGIVFSAPPELTRIEPPGCQRGKETQVVIKGKWQKWPPKFWSDMPGLQFIAEEKEGSVKVVVPPDAPPVPARVRVFDSEGASSSRYLFIDSLDAIVEQEPNDDWQKPQAVSNQQVVYGVLSKRNEVDCFRISLRAEQHVLVNVEANRLLNAPLDACVQIVGARGVVLAQNLDARDLDPQLNFVAPREGEYVVRVFGFPSTPDSTIGFAGGDNFQYRLTLTTNGYIDAAYPSATNPSNDQPILARGFGLPTEPIQLVQFIPINSLSHWVYSNSFAGAVSIEQSQYPVMLESDQQANHDVAWPCLISGCIETPGDEDRFWFKAEKGQSIEFLVRSRNINYPLDALLVIEDESGKSLLQADDDRQDRDPRLNYKPSGSGRYQLVIKDLHGFGGPDYHYQLHIRPTTPRYVTKVEQTNLRGKTGVPLEIKVSIERPDKGLHKLRLQAFADEKIIEGGTAESSGEGESAKQVTISLTATKPYAGPLHLALFLADSLDLQAKLPLTQLDDFWLTVE